MRPPCYTGKPCANGAVCHRSDAGRCLREVIAEFSSTWELMKPSVSDVDDGAARGIARTLWSPLLCEVSELFLRERRADRGDEAKVIIAESLHPLFLEGSLYRMTLRPPFGYKGDYQIIDRLVENSLAGDGVSRVLDASYQESVAARTVRSRLLFLTDYLARRIGRAGGPLAFLSLGSGSAPELTELLRHLDPTHEVTFSLLDIEPGGLDKAKGRLDPKQVPNVQVQPLKLDIRDLLRSRLDVGPGTLDLVYSSGLFDYLSDDLIVALLGKLKGYLKPGGRILFGNFADHAGRTQMELCGEWLLIYRDRADLHRLVERAGLKALQCTAEYLGVNLFMEAEVVEEA